MRFRRNLQHAMSLTWILLLLAGCGAPTVTSTPVSPKPAPVVETVAIDAGGFSFRPIIGFSVEVEATQARMVSEDQKTHFVLAGRSSCEVKPLEDVIDAFVRMFRQGMKEPQTNEPYPIKELQTSQPYPIDVSGEEGLAVDVVGKVYEHGSANGIYHVHRVAGRVVLVAPTDSQYFFSFTSVLDSTEGGQWGAAEEETFDAVINSVTFSEPASASNPFPCFVNHEPRELAGDPELFTQAGCWYDKSGRGTCQHDSPLTQLGCDAIGKPYGGLAPPITRCSVSPGSGCDFSYDCHEDFCQFCYVALQDGQYVLIETEDELQEVFAPIQSGDEVLSYALAVMAGRPRWDGSAYYGLELDPGLEYSVDVIEDTHVETVADGYLIRLYRYQRWGCDHPTFYAIDVLVTPEGNVTPVGGEAVHEDRSQRCIE
jgi:hypothetical protein